MLKAGIVYKEILPKVAGGVVEGYEDIFIDHALKHFKRWAKQQKNKEQSAGTFVNWWTKNKVFSHDKDVFWKLNDKVNNHIKKLDTTAKANREEAKGMTNEEFEKGATLGN